MTLLSIALAAIIHVGVALTCIKVWPTERHAYRGRGPSAHEPNKSRVLSSPNQSGRLSSMATTFQISNTYKERANALFLMHILMHTSSRSHGAPCVHMQMQAFSRPPLRPTTEPEAQTRSYVFRRARRTFLPAEQRIFCHRSAARGPARKLNPSIGAASAAPYGDEV